MTQELLVRTAMLLGAVLYLVGGVAWIVTGLFALRRHLRWARVRRELARDEAQRKRLQPSSRRAMAGNHETDVEKGKAQQRTCLERLKEAVNLLLQHRGLMAKHGLVVPPDLDKKTFTLLHDEAADRESTT